jgi:thiol-disulfide isomerase/thioredoxin
VRHILHALAALLLSAAAAAADGSRAAASDEIDARVDRICLQFEEVFYSVFDGEAVAERAKAIVEGLDLDALRGVHIGRLLSHGYMIEMSGLYEEAIERLWPFLGDPGADGAVAAVHLLRRRMNAADDLAERARLYRETFRHAGLEDAIAARAVEHVLFHADPRDPELLAEVLPDLLALERLLAPELAESLAYQFHAYFEALQRAAEAGHDFDLHRLRKRMVELAEAELARTEHEGRRDVLEKIIPMLSGAAARGELVGHPVPRIELLWSSEPGLQSLDDLRGKVIVLEFWATWCGPCVAALPKTRALQQHYADFDVVFIGASEHYGGVMTQDGWVKAADAAEEAALMAQFIQRHDITWPIVFCEKHTRAEFGGASIPSIAIIDAAGVVRHAELHPAQPREELTSRIDALLREAGLPTTR